MPYTRLIIWVEGATDKRFFDKIIKHEFEKYYDWVEVREWAKLKKKKICDFNRNICKMGGDYLLVADIDQFPCVTQKKETLIDKFVNIDSNRIIIVKNEIESWYIAGLNKDYCDVYGICHFCDTETLSKEHFNELVPKKFDQGVSFMLEILESKCYCTETAKKQNNSFKYFVTKYNICI